MRALEKFDTEEYEALTNIRFVCMDARNVEEVFVPEEVDKIFLNFSDPWPKARHAKRRLTSTEFLERYEKILAQAEGLSLRRIIPSCLTFHWSR